MLKMMVLFDEKLDDDLLNQQILSRKIQRYVVKIASQPIYFIGVTKNDLITLAKNIKTNQDEIYKNQLDLKIFYILHLSKLFFIPALLSNNLVNNFIKHNYINY